MDKNELMAYLKDAYELESQLYTLNQIKKEYKDVIQDLERRKFEPLYVEEYFDGTDDSPYEKLHESFWGRDTIYLRLNGHYVTTSYSLEMYEISPQRAWNGELLSFLEFLISSKHKFKNIRSSWDTPEYRALKENSIKEESKNNGFFSSLTGRKNYVAAEKLREYLCDCYRKDYKLKEIWFQERIDALTTECENLILKEIEETKKVLDSLYSINFIHPKYRHLVAVSQIYEYLDTNRCDGLEGPDGAYNLFESELRQDIIIMKLDIIIEKLDELISAMYYVASAVKESNRILSNISGQLGHMSTSLSLINNNTALTAYNTQCISFNTELMRRYS